MASENKKFGSSNVLLDFSPKPGEEGYEEYVGLREGKLSWEDEGVLSRLSTAANAAWELNKGSVK